MSDSKLFLMTGRKVVWIQNNKKEREKKFRIGSGLIRNMMQNSNKGREAANGTQLQIQHPYSSLLLSSFFWG